MPRSTILEIPEHELDDEEWEEVEELGEEDEDLDLDEYGEDLDDDDEAAEI
jgi:hypothetical protein